MARLGRGIPRITFIPEPRRAIFYVATGGSDSNPGTATLPWLTISKVNSVALQPGDTVLFNGGNTFTGEIYVSAGGSTGDPITFGSYGTGRATITNSTGHAFNVYDVSNIVIKDLILVGTSTAFTNKSGVSIYGDNATRYVNVTIDNVDAAGWQNGISIGGASVGGYDTVLINNCDVHGNRDAGLISYGPTFTGANYSHANVTVTNCRAYSNLGNSGNTTTNSGNGIVLGMVTTGLIDQCVAYSNGASNAATGEGPVGIWTYNANAVVIQSSLSYSNRTGTAVDGGGFDIDINCKNCVIQYCEAYDNSGAGVLLFGNATAGNWTANTVRFNVLWGNVRNTTAGTNYGELALYGTLESSHVYGNTMIARDNASNNIAALNSTSGTFTGLTVRNNILMSQTGLVVNVATAYTTGQILMQGNDYYRTAGGGIKWGATTYATLAAWRAVVTGQEQVSGVNKGYQVDPQLNAAATTPTATTVAAMLAATSLQLSVTSPLAAAGIDLLTVFAMNPGVRDFWGTALTVPLAIGASDNVTGTRLSFPSLAVADTLYSSAPTITLTAGATTTIASGTLVAPTDSRFRYRGAGGWAYGVGFPLTTVYAPNSNYNYAYGSPSMHSVTFEHTGTTFEVMYYLASTSGGFRMKVNGQRVHDIALLATGMSAGSRHMRKFVFGSSDTRVITLEQSFAYFGGVYVNTATDTISTPPAFNARMIITGDSITGGSSQTTGLGAGTYPWRLADYVGVDDVWNEGIGATGYVDPGAAVKLIDRINDVITNAPDVVIVSAGFNDTGETAGTVQTAATTYFNALRAGLPAAEIYVMGNWVALATPSAGMITVDTEIKAAALAASVPYISPLSGDVFDATGTLLGNIGEWVADSADVTAYIGGDSVHPNDAGHVRIAQQMRKGLMLLYGEADTTEQTATVTMAGAGTLSVTATPVVLPTLTMAGTGSMAVTPLKTVLPTAVAMAGSGTMAVTPTVTRTGVVPMAGSGTMSVTPAVGVVAAVPMSGAGVMAVTPAVTRTGVVPMSGAGTLAVTPAVSISATVAMVGSGAMTVTTEVTRTGILAMAGAGAMSVIGTQTVSSTVTMAGTGAMTVTATVQISVSMALSGAGVLTITGTRGVNISLTLAGAATMTVAAAKTVFATVAFAGVGTLTVTAASFRTALVFMVGTGVMAVTATKIITISAVPMDGTGALSISADVIRTGILPMVGVGTMEVSTSLTVLPSLLLAGSGTMGVTTTLTRTGILLLTGSGSMAVTGASTTTATILLTGSGTLSIAPLVTHPVTIAMSGMGVLTLTGAQEITAVLLVEGVGELSLTAGVSSPSDLTMHGQGYLVITPTVDRTGVLVMAGHGTLFVVPAVQVLNLLLMSGSGVLSVTATTSSNVSIPMAGHGILTVTGTSSITATVVMSGAGTLSVAALLIHSVTVTLTGAGVMSVSTVGGTTATVPMAGSGVMSVTVKVIRTGIVLMAAGGLLTISGSVTSQNSVDLDFEGHGILHIAGFVTRPGILAIQGTGTLSVTSVLTHMLAVAFAGNGTLQITAVVVRTAAVLMAGQGTLSIVAASYRAAVLVFAGAGQLSIISDFAAPPRGPIRLVDMYRPPRTITLRRNSRISIGGPTTQRTVTGPR